MRNLRKDVKRIIDDIIPLISCDNTIINVLKGFKLPKGNLYLVSIGKVAFNMVKKAEEILHELIDINTQLFKNKANIVEINIIRKRLSKVKGDKFALHWQHASIYTIVLSDIIDDPIDMIASGPTGTNINNVSILLIASKDK